jgi:glycosyltransferase involved in cell wall biosynthesis
MKSSRKILGVVVGNNNNWTFFREIYADMQRYYNVVVCTRPRLNLPLAYRIESIFLNLRLRNLLISCDAVFFEWVDWLLAKSSYLPKRAKIIARLHSLEVGTESTRVNWANVDKIITVSNTIRERLIVKASISPTKIVTIYNGVDLKRFSSLQEPAFHGNIGIVGRLVPIKRIYDLVLTFAQLRFQGYPYHLYIGGSIQTGADNQAYATVLFELPARLGFADAVHFSGHVSDTPNWLRNIDILVSNSYWEGQPVALLEGMASGCYCLSHHWPGADEILPEENIYYLDSELQEKIKSFAGYPQTEQVTIRKRMRAIAEEKFDLERMLRNTRELVNEVISRD